MVISVLLTLCEGGQQAEGRTEAGTPHERRVTRELGVRPCAATWSPGILVGCRRLQHRVRKGEGAVAEVLPWAPSPAPSEGPSTMVLLVPLRLKQSQRERGRNWAPRALPVPWAGHPLPPSVGTAPKSPFFPESSRTPEASSPAPHSSPSKTLHIQVKLG